MLVNMKEILRIAEEQGYAIPCINTPNEETARAVVAAAEELNTPVMIDHVEGHDTIAPIERIGPVMLQYAREAKVPVCVHLDHGQSYDFVMRAVKVGFPSIMYDCSRLPLEENIARVKKFVEFAHAAGITVEAELGIMASTDDGHGDCDDPDQRVITNEDIKKFFTDPEEAKRFAEETGCDALACCFGTMHGIYAEPPVLDIERVKALRKAIPDSCRVVIHGTSGVDFEQVQEAIAAGVSKVNYYSYLAKSTTEHITKLIEESETTIPYHELHEAAYEHMKEYAKEVITAFKCGKN